MVLTIRPETQFVSTDQSQELVLETDVVAIKNPADPKRESIARSLDKVVTQYGYGAGRNPEFASPDPLMMIFGFLSKMLATFKELVSTRNMPADNPVTQQVADYVSSMPIVHDTDLAVDETFEKNSERSMGIWTGFALDENYRWRPNNNTVHVATIKAAMVKFGQSPSHVFNVVRPLGEGHEIIMRDGFELHVSHDELARATQASCFMGRDNGMLKDANFMLAAAIKRKQMESPEPSIRDSYDAALLLSLSLNGEQVLNMFEYLGLARDVRPARPGELATLNAVGVHVSYPASAVINGVSDVLGRSSSVPEKLGGYVLL